MRQVWIFAISISRQKFSNIFFPLDLWDTSSRRGRRDRPADDGAAGKNFVHICTVRSSVFPFISQMNLSF